MSNFVSLNTALSALQATRIRLDTAAHNVANVGTKGYTRQRVDLGTRVAYEGPYGQIGQGVEVTDVRRARDTFLDARFRNAQSGFGQLSTHSGLLRRAEDVLAEPDQGITERLSDLWASFEEMGLAPANTGARIAVLGSLEDLAARVRSVWSGWEQLGQDATNRLASTVDEVNGLLRAVGDLNRQISESALSSTPNELLDKRDVIVDRLSELLGASAVEAENGTVRVSIGGLGLVDGMTVRSVTLNADNTISHASGTVILPGGEVSGYQRFLTENLPANRSKLNAFAADLADALNAQHSAGWVDESTQGGNLLDYVPGAAARTLSVAFTDPARLAVSSDPGPPFPTYNGVNAQKLAELRTVPVAAGGTETLDAVARSMAVELGAQVAAAGRATDAQRGLATAARLAREGEHGVSLDEEMAGLIEAQHAYEAAARVMSAIDETLETLIRRTGVVGR